MITTHSFVYDYIKNSVAGPFIKVHPKCLSTIDAGRFNYIFYDVGKDSQLSFNVINNLRIKSKFMIFLTPSNDKQILRTFPFYLFDGQLDYPFNKLKLTEQIKVTSSEFKKTREIVSSYKNQKYKDVIKISNMKVNNEKDLICVYHSLLENNYLNEAEEIKKKFYDKEKLPSHPEIKLIKSIFYSKNFDEILNEIKNNINYYCNTIQEQIVLHSIGFHLNNEHRSSIDDTLGRSVLYIQDVIFILDALKEYDVFENVSEEDIKRFIYNRDFNIFPKSSPLTQSMIISLTYKLSDVNAINFLLMKEFKFSPLIATISKKIIEDRVKVKNIALDFDNTAIHINFLRNYKRMKYLPNKDSILSSVFLLSLRDSKNIIRPMIKKLGDFYMENDIYSTYQVGKCLKKELSSIDN